MYDSTRSITCQEIKNKESLQGQGLGKEKNKEKTKSGKRIKIKDHLRKTDNYIEGIRT